MIKKVTEAERLQQRWALLLLARLVLDHPRSAAMPIRREFAILDGIDDTLPYQPIDRARW